MAPLLIERTNMLEIASNQLKERGLGGNSSSLPAPNLSIHNQTSLQILAVTFSAISVFSAMLAFYWFLQMRRSFRHHLIMLLIQSDMFKALWFLIYPIVVFVHGPQASNSTFCQINGFFISLGIEASDFAILMIAIHSALYIFRPVAAAGEGGLYPYRRIAYVLWVMLPLLAASLAFVNGPDKAYISQDTYCYLPIRPFWFRLALSWIPRYAIFLIIFGIYATIYFYVRYKFHNFNKNSQNDSDLSKSTEQNSIQRIKKNRKHSLPETPPLAYNGLIPNSRSNSFSEQREHRPNKPSISTLDSEATHVGGDLGIPFDAGVDAPCHIDFLTNNYQNHLLEGPNGSSFNSASARFSEEVTIAALSPNTVDTFEGQPIATHDFIPFDEEPKSPTRPFSKSSTLISKNSFKSFFNRPIASSANSAGSRNVRSVIGMTSILKHADTTPTTIDSDLVLIDTHGQNPAVSELVKTRDRIRKQLRFLFIYPLVYIAMWVVPFINHTLQYNDRLARDPPYALSCATVIFVTLQCAVDCWLFSTRERPWRHMPSNEEGTFWGSFVLWRGSDRLRRESTGNRGLSGPGKSRAEQAAEARMAYKRREQEAETWKRNDAERKRIRAEMESGSFGSTEQDIGVSGMVEERNWWDFQHGFDGPVMSPVEEEVDPIDLGTTKSDDDIQVREPEQEQESDSKEAPTIPPKNENRRSRGASVALETADLGDPSSVRQ